eukprot:2203413-Pleurochrysis_carterae.AAC.1
MVLVGALLLLASAPAYLAATCGNSLSALRRAGQCPAPGEPVAFACGNQDGEGRTSQRALCS